MPHYHVTGKVRFWITAIDEEGDLVDDKTTILVDGLYRGDDESDAIRAAIEKAAQDTEDEADVDYYDAEAEYRSDTLIAVRETTEEQDARERLSAFNAMKRSGTPSLFRGVA